MNKIFNNLKTSLRSIKMTKLENKRIKDALLACTENNVCEKSKPSPYFKFVIPNVARRAFQIITLVLVFMLTLGTGFAQASQDALPGEILYPVKITAEDVVSAMATSPKAKIDWEIERTSRRMKEAVELAVTEKLDDSKQEVIVENIKKHTEAVSIEIEKIEQEEPEEALGAHSDLKTSLEAHAEALGNIKENLEKDNVNIENIEELEKNIEKVIVAVVVEENIALENTEKSEGQVIDQEADDKNNEVMLARILDLKQKISKLELGLLIRDKEEVQIHEVNIVEIVESEEVIDLPEEPEIIEGVVLEEVPVEDFAEKPILEEIIIGESLDLTETTEGPDQEIIEEESETTEEVVTEDNASEDGEILEDEILNKENIDLDLAEAEKIEEPLEIIEGLVYETNELDIEVLKLQADELIKVKKYGEAVIILEEIYQYLSKQIIVEEIEKEIEEINLNKDAGVTLIDEQDTDIVDEEIDEQEKEIVEIERELLKASVVDIVEEIMDEEDKEETLSMEIEQGQFLELKEGFIES